MKIELTNQDKLKFLSDLADVLEKDGKDLYFAVRDDKQGTKVFEFCEFKIEWYSSPAVGIITVSNCDGNYIRYEYNIEVDEVEKLRIVLNQLFYKEPLDFTYSKEFLHQFLHMK